MLDTLASAQAAEAQIEKAMNTQRQAVDLQPDWADSRLRLAEYAIKAKKKDVAKAELLRLKELGAGFTRQAEVEALLKQI